VKRRGAVLGAALLAFGPTTATAQTGPQWTRGGVCYEIFVRSFQDSNGDGIGDLNGLISRLDYLGDLGVACLWLMPVTASPSYHGYDVSDYYNVEPAYGTNDDFKRLTAEAHRRGIRVLVDMVLNHSSSEHPHFQAALHDATSEYRSWYRFAPRPLGPGPLGPNAWRHSTVRDEYFYGVFWHTMPDLNYETPAVREEAKRVAAFWLQEMGVDGFRLDAVPYLVEEGSCMVGCPGTHAFLAEYAAYLATINPEAYTVGEVWDGNAKLLPYYPGQLTSYFAFELNDSLRSVLRSGAAAGLLRGYLQLQAAQPAYRWSPFTSNHDGTRIMTALGGDVTRAKLAATLVLTLPGLPFIYYGDEIGMTGDKPDPRLRTPMQWNAAPGVGFTTGTPWESPQPDTATVNVAIETSDPGSLLSLYRRLIHLRRDNAALATGLLVPLTTGNAQVAAYLRRAGDHAALVVANLGFTPVTAVVLASAPGALRPGRYQATNLLDGPPGESVTVSQNGRLTSYVPVPGTIAPGESVVLGLERP